MLRAWVAALLLANALFYGWSQGWLDGLVGVRARGDREPERLANQVRPESVVVVASNRKGTELSCLEAGPFAAAEVSVAAAALQTLVPPGTWRDIASENAGTWLVYMGPYPDRATLQRKVAELQRNHVDFSEIAVPSEGEWGLSLGRFDEHSAAERGLTQLAARGVRTARVLSLTAPRVTHTLRVEGLSAQQAAALTTAKLEGLGAGFTACTRP